MREDGCPGENARACGNSSLARVTGTVASLAGLAACLALARLRHDAAPARRRRRSPRCSRGARATRRLPGGGAHHPRQRARSASIARASTSERTAQRPVHRRALAGAARSRRSADDGRRARRRAGADRHRPPDQPRAHARRPAARRGRRIPPLAPLHGTLKGADGAPIATYVMSVWADSGFLAESRGVAEGVVALRTTAGASVGGTPALGAGALPSEGALTLGRRRLPVHLLPGAGYPVGRAAGLPAEAARARPPPCADARVQDTTVNTLRRVAQPDLRRRGRRARTRAQVAPRPEQPAAAGSGRPPRPRRQPNARSDALLNHHIVRLRVEHRRAAARRRRRPLRAGARSARRCGSTGARSAASCSRSRTTRATCVSPGASPASTC